MWTKIIRELKIVNCKLKLGIRSSYVVEKLKVASEKRIMLGLILPPYCPIVKES